MPIRTFRGVVRGGIVVPEKEAQLHEGAEVVITPVGGVTGSPAAVLAALEAAPKVPPQWVDELEQLIEQGRRPPMKLDLFSEEHGSEEAP